MQWLCTIIRTRDNNPFNFGTESGVIVAAIVLVARCMGRTDLLSVKDYFTLDEKVAVLEAVNLFTRVITPPINRLKSLASSDEPTPGYDHATKKFLSAIQNLI